MIPDNYKPIRQVGNGNTVSFAFDFPLISENFVEVYREKNGTQSVVGRNEYSVSMTNNGGNVVFNTAPSKGEIIVITRRVPLEQDTPYKTSSGFPAVRIEENFDAQIAIAQQLQEQIDRCVKVEVTGDQTPEALLDEVYNKLDSATEVAEQAIGAANQATTAAKDAKDAVVVAQQQITETQAFIEQARTDINQTVEDSIAYVEQEAVKAATEVVGEVVGQYTDRAETAAKNAEADASRTAESADRASASATSAATSASEAEAIAGEISVYNFKNKITNCITEIPQDIKLELNNGTLTLKAGSKVYVPNGKNTDGSLKFDVVTISNDVSNTRSSNVQEVYFVSNNGKTFNAWRYCFSGTTAPTFTGSYAIWYDTANNIVKYTTNAGSTWGTGFSLPVCLSTSNTAQITSIDQVFNGFGYIGSTVFALPNVKGLIPDGRNEDGSLKNTEFTVNRVLTRTITDTGTRDNTVVGFSPYRGSFFGFSLSAYYDGSTNFNKENGSNWPYTLIGNASYSATKLTSFTPKLPFRAVDQNDFNKLDEEAVKTSGNQTISGAKTFMSPMRVSGNNTTIYVKNTEIEQGVNPSANKATYPFYVMDKNEKLLCFANFVQATNGDVATSLNVRNQSGNSTGSLKIGYSSNGVLYTSAPTPPASDDSTKIATTAWVHTRINPTGTYKSWKITYNTGFKIMGGFLTPASTTSSDWTVTFPTAFSSIPVVQTTYYSTQGTGHNLTRNVTTTGFYFEAPSTGGNYHHNATGLGWVAYGF